MKFEDFILNLLAGVYGGVIVFAFSMFQQRFYPNPSYQEFLLMSTIPVILFFIIIINFKEYMFKKK